MLYNAHMETTVRNMDEAAYRQLKARAALTGRTIGDLMTEAIRSYLAMPAQLPKQRSLGDLEPEDYPEGNERLSESVDTIVYGV